MEKLVLLHGFHFGFKDSGWKNKVVQISNTRPQLQRDLNDNYPRDLLVPDIDYYIHPDIPHDTDSTTPCDTTLIVHIVPSTLPPLLNLSLLFHSSSLPAGASTGSLNASPHPSLLSLDSQISSLLGPTLYLRDFLL
jgi:hypothetical protein